MFYEIYDYFGEYGFVDSDWGEEFVCFWMEVLVVYSKMFVGVMMGWWMMLC